MRYAIYFTPPAGDRLTRIAADWLGRNAFSGALRDPSAFGSLSAAAVERHTAFPRRYGFHATLKAPFAMAEGRKESELLRALMLFCDQQRPFSIPRLEIRRLGSFFALTPAEPVDELDALAAAVVRAFDPFRRPPSEAEIARRDPARLTERQRANLHRWGYPYVFEDFQFHMTLTGSVPGAEAPAVEKTLASVFAPVLDEPVPVRALALFTEAEAGGPFVVHSLHPLGRIETRKTA